MARKKKKQKQAFQNKVGSRKSWRQARKRAIQPSGPPNGPQPVVESSFEDWDQICQETDKSLSAYKVAKKFTRRK